MVGLPYDCLANPLGAVRSTFEMAIARGSDPLTFDGKDWGALEPFRRFLFDQDGLSQVPILNASNIRRVTPNTLVRFRGMIQDMLGNEFYVGAYKDGSIWRTNKFMDTSQYPLGSSPDMRVWERRLLYCVPVPGWKSWTDESSSSEVTMMNQCQKRRRMDDEFIDQMDMVEVQVDEPRNSPSAKKMREDGHAAPTTKFGEFSTEAACSSLSRMGTVVEECLPCLVKIYDTSESEIKLNDVFEFIGIVTFEEEDEVNNDENEDMLVQMPPNKVPRLHCLIHRKLSINEFLHSCHMTEPKPHLAKEIREALLKHLTAVLGNDGVAAHFLLLHLLSMVNARVDTVAVGKLSLNLTRLDKESMSIFGTKLQLAVKSLLPFTHFIPFTVEYLNTAALAPKKDYEMNRLIPGVLQLPEGSHVTIDETKLEAGTLSSVGVENVRLLNNLIELQKVEYDFKYYKMEMAADVQLLILSEGKSNILPADLVVPFRPSSVYSSEVLADTEALAAWRWYLTTLRSLPHSIDSEMQQVVENDLVAARQADRSLGSRDFSRLLTMARLMSVSFGESCLTLEHWQMVKELERLRKERLK